MRIDLEPTKPQNAPSVTVVRLWGPVVGHAQKAASWYQRLAIDPARIAGSEGRGAEEAW